MKKSKLKTPKFPFLFFILSSILNYQNMFMLKDDHFLFFLLYPLRLLVFVLITIISVEIIAVSSQSIDLRFEACRPRHCGNGVNISYPFWIDAIQQDYCGCPEFRVTCRNGAPVLHSSGNDYIIRDIFYEEKSFRVENSIGKDSCPSPIQNTTFDEHDLQSSTANIPPFKLGPNVVNLSFFYNCTIDTTYFPDGPDPNYAFYPKNCKYTDSQHFSFVMASVPTYLDDWNSRCKTLVLVPVEVGVGREFSSVEPMTINRSNYTLLLENGFLLEWNKTDCKQCQESGGYCGFDKEVLVCFCVDGPYPNRCNDDDKLLIYHQGSGYKGKKKIVIGITAGVSGFIIASLMVICYCMRKKYSLHSHSTTFWRKKLNENGHQNMEVFFKNCGSLAPKRYRFSDIKKMTNSFEQKLGEGGFGAVFKGTLHDGMLVAVKVLFSKSERDGEDFINEVTSISRTSHVNIVTLHGFCFEKKKMALIYEFMPNGSLEKFIYNKAQFDQLGWETIYQISVGIARGLEYLHRGCITQILHFDIKPHNVLLDQDFCPKISDFGLAKLCLRKESRVSILGARGTPGYIAPEVFCRNFGRVSYKSDVYSYGMMILEMVGGRKNIDVKVGMDHISQLYFPHWIYERLERNEDLGLRGVLTDEREELARKMIIVGLWCIQTNPPSRPSMSKVLEMLEGTIEALQIPPKPMLSSPTKSPPVSSSNIVSALQIQPEPIISSISEPTSVSSSTIVSIS